MTTQDIALDLVALCREGKFAEAGDRYWADDVVAIEATEGEGARMQGKANLAAKGAAWSANTEVHSGAVEGPYINGDQFLVRFTLDMTRKAAGQRLTMDEMALYTVRDGKIVEERFFLTPN